jgi:hypothetical protein
MSRVQLVVTGKCELVLHESLEQVFPELEWLPPIYMEGFTSTELEGPLPPGLRRTIDKFARELIVQVDSDGDCLVIGVDDLERNAPEVTTGAIRSAVSRVLLSEEISQSEARRARVEAELRERCSFHVLRPMVEAYFFGEPAALDRAGRRRPSRFDAATTDVELFTVSDEEFTGPPDVDDKHDWRRGGSERHAHPKRYLKFLTSNAEGIWTYRETRDGQAALRSLDWARVCGNAAHAAAVRALLNDVADFARSAARDGEELDATSRGTMRDVRVLRNL